MADKKTVLIVEDDVALVKLVKTRLESEEYNVLTASDGELGLREIADKKPDLVLLDINMPRMGGIELYRKISDKDGRPKVPVLVLTARAELEDFFDGIEVNGFISKPCDMNYLAQEVARIIAGKPKPAVFLIDREINPYAKEMKKKLKKAGYTVEITDGIEKFKAAATARAPDFILMEFMQKETKGEDLIRKIKETISSAPKDAQPSKSKTPVIVYCQSGVDREKESLGAGADIYIGKPEASEQIVSALKKATIKLAAK